MLRFLLLLIALMPGSALACQPIVQLALLFGLAPAVSIGSLGVGVALKCGAFAVLERRSGWVRAAGGMLIANVVSSVVGILAALPSVGAPPEVWILILLVVGLAAWIPARRLSVLLAADGRAIPTLLIAGAFPSAMIASSILFAIAGSQVERGSLLVYWLLKLGYVTAGLVVGMGLSTLWEEWVVAKLVGTRHPSRSFFASVFRANYITFGAVLLVMAVKTLPTRLESPRFLAELGRLARELLG